jgi:hypothetical protein
VSENERELLGFESLGSFQKRRSFFTGFWILEKTQRPGPSGALKPNSKAYFP